MNQEVKIKLKKIRALCQSHNVESISLFGSAAKNNLKADSDLDFLVRFSNNIELLDYADNYFNLQEQLQALFNRQIDLISERSLKNPILIQEINNSKISLYES